MSSKEYKFLRNDEWVLVRIKRDWVPEVVFKFLVPIVFLFPLNVILTAKVPEEEEEKPDNGKTPG